MLSLFSPPPLLSTTTSSNPQNTLWLTNPFAPPHYSSTVQEWYTDKQENVDVRDGALVLTARTATEEERLFCCADGPCPPGNCTYTSGRVRTYNKFAVAPSTTGRTKTIRIQIRAQLPAGDGLWPALWMLPEDSPANCSGCGAYGSWAASGAITLAQGVNSMEAVTGGIAFGGAFPNQTSATYGADLRDTSSGYHDFALEWSLQRMRWFVDGKKVFEALSGKDGEVPNGWYTDADNAGPNSPFDKPFYLLLNLAAGGTATNASEDQVAETLAEPKEMRVDYVRVCSK